MVPPPFDATVFQGSLSLSDLRSVVVINFFQERAVAALPSFYCHAFVLSTREGDPMANNTQALYREELSLFRTGLMNVLSDFYLI